MSLSTRLQPILAPLRHCWPGAAAQRPRSGSAASGTSAATIEQVLVAVRNARNAGVACSGRAQKHHDRLHDHILPDGRPMRRSGLDRSLEALQLEYEVLRTSLQQQGNAWTRQWLAGVEPYDATQLRGLFARMEHASKVVTFARSARGDLAPAVRPRPRSV